MCPVNSEVGRAWWIGTIDRFIFYSLKKIFFHFLWPFLSPFSSHQLFSSFLYFSSAHSVFSCQVFEGLKFPTHSQDSTLDKLKHTGTHTYTHTPLTSQTDSTQPTVKFLLPAVRSEMSLGKYMWVPVRETKKAVKCKGEGWLLFSRKDLTESFFPGLEICPVYRLSTFSANHKKQCPFFWRWPFSGFQ